jgi:hypothetical protein
MTMKTKIETNKDRKNKNQKFVVYYVINATGLSVSSVINPNHY